MKKFNILYVILSAAAFAADSPLSRVRTVAYDSEGIPSEEVHDISICLERSPSAAEKKNYEDVIGYYADGLYEATNGANYIGKVTIYPGKIECTNVDINWYKSGKWPNAGGIFPQGTGGIVVSDDWGQSTSRLTNDASRFNFGITLVHETMHYRYGIDDDYAKTTIWNEGYFELIVNQDNDFITIVDKMEQKKKIDYPTFFKNKVSAFSTGTAVIFRDTDDNGNLKGSIPKGLPSAQLSGSGYQTTDYAIIDQVDASRIDEGIYSFSLKDANGNRINIKSKGNDAWGLDLPNMGRSVYNASSVAHSIMNYQYDVATSRTCDPDNIQWQWANLSSSFNINENSPMGMAYRDADGSVLSAWDVLTTDPKARLVYGRNPSNFWYWYKSLIKKKPKASDVFTAKSFLLNYDENTGKVLPGYAVWMRNDACGSENTYSLPYIKANLAGRLPTEYEKETRKHLNIQWVNDSKIETIILIDNSASMADELQTESGNIIPYNGRDLIKMDMARQAAKYIAQGVLSAFPKTGTSSSSVAEYDVSNISVGVYAFNSKITSTYPLTSNPDLATINKKIDATTVKPQLTHLFDAIYSVINNFSSDPTSQKVLYLITDGLDVGSTSHTKEDVIHLYKNRDIAIHTFAYGVNADLELLSSMANETNGSFYENEQYSPIKTVDVVASALSLFPNNEQLKSGAIAPNNASSDIYIPARTKIAKIYGSYTGTLASSPIEIVSKSGTVLPSVITSNNIGIENNFIAEIDSLTLAKLSNPIIKIKNKLTSKSINFRAVSTSEYQEHSLNVSLNPSGAFVWPSQRSFAVSIRGFEGLLANVDVRGKLTAPDGATSSFIFHDDGTSGDFRSGDGIYFAFMPQISKNGTYRWEIIASNKNKSSHTTRIGRTLPDSIPYVEKNDVSPFELIRNGQFIVQGCCTDESDVNKPLLTPNNQLDAFLQTGSDVDKFEIGGTKNGKSYSLRLTSNDLNAFEKVQVFSASDPTTPLYSVNVESSLGTSYVTIPLSAEYAKPGYVVSISGTSSNGSNYSLLLLERNYAEFAIGRFEVNSDWHSDQASVALDSHRKKEGVRSLVSPAGWKIIESRAVSTSDFDLIGEKLGLDLFVPSNTQNPYWIGSVEIWLSVPSSNKRIQIGTQKQLIPYLGGWQTHVFKMPENAIEIFKEPHPDVHFQIVLNSADSLWIDNLHFEGNLEDNTVNKWLPECPGDSGCSPDKPLQLQINESIRVVAEGDLWIEIVGFPSDWTPAIVNVGVSPEDGNPLTGYLSFENSTVSLHEWYSEISYSYSRVKRQILKLHNIAGRPYRMNAWISGQVLGVAMSQLDFKHIWKIEF